MGAKRLGIDTSSGTAKLVNERDGEVFLNSIEYRGKATRKVIDHEERATAASQLLHANGINCIRYRYNDDAVRTSGTPLSMIFDEVDAFIASGVWVIWEFAYLRSTVNGADQIGDFWHLISERYKNNDGIAAYDLFNEPGLQRPPIPEARTYDQWMDTMVDAIGRIRANKDTHICLVANSPTPKATKMLGSKNRPDRLTSNVAVTPHFYEGANTTHSATEFQATADQQAWIDREYGDGDTYQSSKIIEFPTLAFFLGEFGHFGTGIDWNNYPGGYEGAEWNGVAGHPANWLDKVKAALNAQPANLIGWNYYGWRGVETFNDANLAVIKNFPTGCRLAKVKFLA